MSQFRFAGLGQNPNYFQRPLGQTTDWNQDGISDDQQPPPPEWPINQFPWPPDPSLEPGQYPPGYNPNAPPPNGNGQQNGAPPPPPPPPATTNGKGAWLRLPLIGGLPPIFQLVIIAGGAWWLWMWWNNRDPGKQLEDYVGG